MSFKNKISAVCAAALLCFTTGCTLQKEPEKDKPEGSSLESTAAGLGESSSDTGKASGTMTDEKIVLKITDFSKTEYKEDPNAPEPVIVSRNVNIPFELSECTETNVIPSEAESLIETVREDYPDFGGDGWSYVAHLITDDGSLGMIRFLYHIGEISANKAVLFFYSDGSITEISYTNMDFPRDEEAEKALLGRVERFMDTHVQEKREMKPGERVTGEVTQFSYNYNSGTLRYFYNLFFEYGDPPVINNDFGTECIVD